MDDFFEKYADRIMPEPNSGCWLWTGSASGAGYGNLTRYNRVHSAHRCAYEAAHGKGSAAGAVCRHTCDNSYCVNPAHLLIGTYKDNWDDAFQRGRLRVVRGEGLNLGVLTEDLVASIRSMAANGATGPEIAAALGVRKNTVVAAAKGQTWKHVEAPVAVPTRAKPKWNSGVGEERTNAKLTAASVREIKRRLASGEQGKNLAAEYRITPSAVSSIRCGHTWGHIQ